MLDRENVYVSTYTTMESSIEYLTVSLFSQEEVQRDCSVERSKFRILNYHAGGAERRGMQIRAYGARLYLGKPNGKNQLLKYPV